MARLGDNCPICGENSRAGDACSGCQADLASLTDVERQARRLGDQARCEYARGRYRRAAELAAALVTLDATPENIKLLACAQLLAGDFPRAFRTSRRLIPASTKALGD